MKYKGLVITVLIGFAFLLASLLFPNNTFNGWIYLYILIFLPLLTAILIGLLIFGSDKFKNGWKSWGIIRKIFSIIGGSIIIFLTWFISAFIVLYIGLSNNPPGPSSTYGTPIHRPKIK